MSYIDENLMNTEVIVHRAHLHWSIFMSALLTFILAVFATSQHMSRFDWILYLIAATLVIISAVRYLTSEFAVTNKRVIVKIGFISRNSYEMLLSKIEGIEVEQGILGRILSYGSIIVRGVGGSKEVFYKIENPLEFRRKVQEQIAAISSAINP